ncbi:putative glutaminyl-tRNA synthase (glutamine-hydrolyzing) [Medicago truncatula]|uniref:Putative glutaminyl-tRNA synthase (Glutamine-hydrolyzing) n=1 Tax=Medicago truncatula TaxID=3880 RepID=A0A396I7C2_MEDTR|nr:putative glutaminyl-tRNA synthase (glutamine-hydrolyzing) [Medicago truncatula]
MLHGIPVLIKDSIATFDKLNTTAGSYALLGSKVPRDAHVVSKLRDAGAIILGKTSLPEWYGIRSSKMLGQAWCPRGGFGLNPYVESESPCTSSFG